MRGFKLFGLRIAIAATIAVAAIVSTAGAQCTTQPCLCTGDCDGDGEVSITELQFCINAFLGDLSCSACDQDLDEEVSISELQGTINGFLDSTACPPVTVAQLDVGSTSGVRGGQATVPIRLAAHIDDVLTIAPVRLQYNSAALTFVGCNSPLPAKTVAADAPSDGVVSAVLYANPFAQPAQALTPIPAGVIINCTFGIKAGAPLGNSAVTFVSAGLADASFNDIAAAGNGGVVSIQ